MKYTTKTVIDKFKSIHGNKYNYSKVNYGKNQLDNVIIICPKHGEFLQTPKQHIKGSGCKKCGYKTVSEKTRLSEDQVFYRFNLIHNRRYNYEQFQYKGWHTKSNIVCKKHGIFKQSPSQHYDQKSGCPKCFEERRQGFNLSKWCNNVQELNKNAILYLIKIYDDKEEFLKIGITSDSIEKRFERLHLSGYKYKILNQLNIPCNPRMIALLEIELHQNLQHFSYTPLNYFKGRGECYNIDYLNDLLLQWNFELKLMEENSLLFESGREVRQLRSAMAYTGSKTLNEFKQ